MKKNLIFFGILTVLWACQNDYDHNYGINEPIDCSLWEYLQSDHYNFDSIVELYAMPDWRRCLKRLILPFLPSRIIPLISFYLKQWMTMAKGFINVWGIFRLSLAGE